jgi:hypothetical protein
MVILHSRKRPIFVRPLSDAERKSLEAGLRSPSRPSLCAPMPDPARQRQRQKRLPDRSRTGLQSSNRTQRHHTCLQQEGAPGGASARFEASPHRSHRAFQGPEQAEALRELLHQKPRKFGTKTRVLWTLDLAADS